MDEQSVWRDLLLGYRKKHVLTQADAALRLKVSQQTISRWESGKQEPDPGAQMTLRSELGLLSLTMRDHWIHRISMSAGREHLFAKGWKILAISEKIKEAKGYLDADMVGRTLAEIPFFAPLVAVLERSGLFEGETKHYKVKTELHFLKRSVGRVVDYWPILTGTDEILVHGVAYPYAIESTYPAQPELRVIETYCEPIRG
jgi:DNA-binding XRE family transcriptional regulator